MYIDFSTQSSIKNLLVHTCCAPCSSYVFERLVSDNFNIEGFFYNPNIHPHGEYARRLEELILFAESKNYRINIQEDLDNFWYELVRGFEQEKEGGLRCKICFQLRLEKTAMFASQNGFDGFTTTLTISPHKNAELINKIGKELESKYGIFFLEADFKKNDGFKRSLELSREYSLYRQSYCGCEFSIRKNNF